MSNSDPNSSAFVKIYPFLSTSSEAPETPEDTVNRRPSQPPPAPPPPPLPLLPPYRAVVPLYHRNPFQQSYGNVYAQSILNRRLNQDPSTVMHPFAPRGRGFLVRPVRMMGTYPSVTARNQIGYRPLPVSAYSQRQFGPNQMEAMMQFMRARNPQIRQFLHPGLGSHIGSGPMRGNPHFLQPRVASPSTSILETSRSRKARSRDEELTLIRGRKVRITEGASLYSLSRSWLRNGAQGGIQPKRSDAMKPLPKPLPVEMMETSVLNDPAEEPDDEDKEDEESVKDLSEKDLLKRHIERAKKVRARFREERWKKIKRFKARLALLLPES